MKASARVAVATIVVMGLMGSTGAGASVSAKTKKLSAEKYAKSMCTTYNTVIDELGAFAKQITTSSASQTDPAAFQAEVSTFADEFLAALAKDEQKLKRIYPDVDGGKKIAKQFSKNPTELKKLVGDAVDTFLAADPTSPAFSASVTVFSVTLSTMVNQLTDVTTGIDDQDFINAVGGQKACHKIFPVTGG